MKKPPVKPFVYVPCEQLGLAIPGLMAVSVEEFIESHEEILEDENEF